jgi:secretion/DNA translocation related TadE-like protein
MRWRQPNPGWGERGSASLSAVALMAVLLAITIGGVYVGSAVVARHRAQAAADLAALAAAAGLAEGAEAACAQASVVAQAMRAAVLDCGVEGLDVVVTVGAAVPLGRFGVRPARAHARAGPVDTAG